MRMVTVIVMLAFLVGCQAVERPSSATSPSPNSTRERTPSPGPSTIESPTIKIQIPEELSIYELSLGTPLSQAINRHGQDFEKSDFGPFIQYHWSALRLTIEAKDDQVLRITGPQITINGSKIIAAEETRETLIQKFGEPIEVLHATHGEPCYTWQNGFQATTFSGDEEFDKLAYFAITTKPRIHALDDALLPP